MFKLPKQDLVNLAKEFSNDINTFNKKSFLITGGTGFIGKWLIATLNELNKTNDFNISLTILTRDKNKFISTFVDDKDIKNAANEFLKKGIKNVIITLGEKGIYFANRDENFFLEAYKLKKAVIDTTGAGDAFNGAFAVGLANDLDIKEALSFANKVAGISTTRLGAAASMPFAKELENN